MAQVQQIWAAEICQQTLLMMTETQHDGLRGLVRRCPSVSVVSFVFICPSVLLSIVLLC